MIDSWTTGTAAAAFVLYVVSLSLRITSVRSARTALAIESCAWLILVVHVAFAFHEHHHWSHAVAEEHVADLTSKVVGIRWGGGIYFNHVLLVLWPIGIARHWRYASEATRKATEFDRAIDVFVALMWLSATVLFGSTGFRILGAIGCGWIAIAAWRARSRLDSQRFAADQAIQH